MAARSLVAALAVLGVGYWLFADTVARYSPRQQAANEVRFSYWGGFDDQVIWRKIIAMFEARHPGITVQPEWLPLSGYATKLDQQFVAGDPPDVIMFQDEPFPRYAADQFADLGRLLADDAEARAWLDDCWPTAGPSFQCRGETRGLPVMGGNILVFCNLNAFDRAGRVHHRTIAPPRAGWTLDEFVAVCRDLTIDEDGDGHTDQFGLLQPHWVYYLPFIWSHGARLLDDSRTRWALVGPEAEAAFAMYADLRHRWGVAPAPIEYAGQNSDTAFLSGRVAMCVNGPWFQAFLRQTSLRDRYCVIEIPRGPGGWWTRVTWDGLCLSAKSPVARRANAWRFARFVLSVEAQEVFAAHQRAIPARRAAAEAFITWGGGPGSPAEEFVNAMDHARVQPITPCWQGMARAVSRHLTSVILDGDARRSPEQALSALAADGDIVRAYGRAQ